MQSAVKTSILNAAYHNDTISRLREAKQNSIRWATFLQNCTELIGAEGFTEDGDEVDVYFKYAHGLTRYLRLRLEKSSAQTAACRNKGLRWKDGDTKVMTWQTTMNIVYEAVCANPLRLFLSLSTFYKIKRIICSGDHKQLPPYITSDEDKEALDEDVLLRRTYQPHLANSLV